MESMEGYQFSGDLGLGVRSGINYDFFISFLCVFVIATPNQLSTALHLLPRTLNKLNSAQFRN